MIELILYAALAAMFWPVVIRWWRVLDAIATLDDIRPSTADVAAAEAELPEMRDLHGLSLNATDVEWMDAVARFRASTREAHAAAVANYRENQRAGLDV